MKLIKLSTMLLAMLLSFELQAQAPIARFMYEDAETAFSAGDHSLALTRLREAEQAFGKLNPPILYLRIQIRYAQLQAAETTSVNFDLLDPLRHDVQRYFKDYGAIDALVDQVREIYQISRELQRYPADRTAYETAQRAAAEAQANQIEQAKQAEAAYLAAQLARYEPGYGFRDCPDCPEMVVVPGGTLTVQAVDGPRQIEIRPFAISRFEMTQEQWYQLRGVALPNIHTRCPFCPVEDMLFSPHGIKDKEERNIWPVLSALSKKAGHDYHLPSETQWEWACRGGEQHRYCGGDNLEEVAWFDKGFRGAQMIGLKAPNAYGLFDMTGNAYDGVADSWFVDYDPPSDGGPRFTADIKNNQTVVRGGRALMSNPKHFEVSARNNQRAGLRLARPLQNGVLGIAFESESPSGARITQVLHETAAAQAGLQIGDVITEVDGRPILTHWSLLAYLPTLEAGRVIRISLLRGGQNYQFETTLTAQR